MTSSSAKPSHTVVGLGEALWDILPSGKHLGGAPLNFAYISSLLGEHAVIASRVGNDSLGRDIIGELAARGLDTSALQMDNQLPTGTVEVSLVNGQPQYEILQPVAWDALEFSPEWRAVSMHADAVCFGTLAQRDERSRMAILEFLKNTRDECLRVFDINLRKPFYNRQMIESALEVTTILKMNDCELPEVAAMLGIVAGDETALMREMLRRFRFAVVFVTCGERGAIAVNGSEAVQHPGFPVRVVDTVGAGDAFTAAATHCLLHEIPLEETLAVANRWAAWVASQAGAMPAPPQTSVPFP